MLEQKKYNEAFTKALMASDLPLVVELMEMVDSSKIFSPDLPGGTALEECGQNVIPTPPEIKNVHTKITNLKNDISLQNDQFTSAVKVPMPKMKQNNSAYDSFQTEIFSEADSFFGNEPDRERLDRRSRSRPVSARSQKISDSAGLRNNTDSKLSQFFLLNKY